METLAMAWAQAQQWAKAQEKWPMWPVQIVDVRPRFPLNQMDLGLYTARIASENIGLPGRQGDIRTIRLSH